METSTTTTGRGAGTGALEVPDGHSSGWLAGSLLATPVVAGLMWFTVYEYADIVQGSSRYMGGASDGWSLAPLGTVLVVVCGIVLAVQTVLLLGALPDTAAGRWSEAILAICFGVTVSMTVFGYLGLFTIGDYADGFPDDVLCILGLLVGGLRTVAIPAAVVVWRAKTQPPEGAPLAGRAWARLALLATATVLLVVLPTAANATANPELLLGLALVPVLDIASRGLVTDNWTPTCCS